MSVIENFKELGKRLWDGKPVSEDEYNTAYRALMNAVKKIPVYAIVENKLYSCGGIEYYVESNQYGFDIGRVSDSYDTLTIHETNKSKTLPERLKRKGKYLLSFYINPIVVGEVNSLPEMFRLGIQLLHLEKQK